MSLNKRDNRRTLGLVLAILGGAIMLGSLIVPTLMDANEQFHYNQRFQQVMSVLMLLGVVGGLILGVAGGLLYAANMSGKRASNNNS